MQSPTENVALCPSELALSEHKLFCTSQDLSRALERVLKVTLLTTNLAPEAVTGGTVTPPRAPVKVARLPEVDAAVAAAATVVEVSAAAVVVAALATAAAALATVVVPELDALTAPAAKFDL